MQEFAVGFQMHPQATSMERMLQSARRAEDLGVDSLWVWDHFFPLYDQRNGQRYYDPTTRRQLAEYPGYQEDHNAHFEAWTTITAVGGVTSRATVGTLVSSTHYRNPDLLVDMARTLDHVTGGRAVLGVGAGWFQRDYDEYGYEYPTGPDRLRDLRANLERMRDRREKLNPQPIGDLPVMIGGGGEKVTLRLVAEYADAWNTFGPPELFAKKNAILDDHCAEVGRDPAEIERTVLLWTHEVDDVEAYLAAGAQHLILSSPPPHDTAPLERLLSHRD